MLRSVLETLYNKSGRTSQPGHELKLNVLLGFDGYTGNFAEMRRMLAIFGATYTILGDHSSNFDSGATGEYSYYYGGTPLEDVPKAADAAGTLAIQQHSLRKTFAAKEAKIPLLRVGFPIFDRHHLHRYPIIGYQGALNLLTQFVNTVLDVMEEQAPYHSFDLVR